MIVLMFMLSTHLSTPYVDISLSDNYWETTRTNIRKIRSTATQENDIQRKVDSDKTFYELMDIGYQRRLWAVQQIQYPELTSLDAPKTTTDTFSSSSSSSSSSIGADSFEIRTMMQYSARKISNQFELSSTKEEQLKELKRQKLLQRKGFIRLLPQVLHKYVDYLNSLRKSPTKGNLLHGYSDDDDGHDDDGGGHDEFDANDSDNYNDNFVEWLFRGLICFSNDDIYRIPPTTTPASSSIHSFIYLSMYVLTGELVRNMAVSAVFALITTLNARARMALIYSFLGIHLFIHTSINLSIYVSIYIYLPIYASSYPSIYLYMCPYLEHQQNLCL